MSTSSDAYLFEQIAEAVRIQIARGELRTGDKLPSIRETAERWHCTPGTVQRAYAVLSEEGLIRGKRGGGTIISRNTLQADRLPLRSAVLTNQIESMLLTLLGQGYGENEVQDAFSAALERWEQWRTPTPGVAGDERELRFVGSHDLVIERLAQQLAETGRFRMNTSYRGSLGGLMALARGEADIAGSHLWDEPSDQYNMPFVQHVLPGERIALVTVAGRSFGLIVPPHNPQQLQSLSDLTKKDVRWVNRQPGSGTRVWLDAQLKQSGADSTKIWGYDMVRKTHNEVAAAVASGEATAGLGIQAAAEAADLGFVPMSQEIYQLVIPMAVWDSAVCRSMLDILSSKAFISAIQKLGGYDTAATGDILWIG